MSSLMKTMRRTAILLAVFGMVCPTWTTASEPVTPELKVHDVQLTQDGTLQITVVNAQGKAQANTSVEVIRSGETEGLVGVTDKAGRYQATGLKGGAYQIRTDQGLCACRIWTHRAAPPTSAKSLLVVNDRVVRGQRPIRELFRSDPILMTAIVAAAIAIPVALSNNDDNGS